MSATVTPLAAGPGWSASDVVCTAGPHDRPFEERHEAVCLAIVCAGSFRYRTRQGEALLAPGSVLLGNPGACFECGHEHATGDRCLALHFAPARWEEITAAVAGARRTTLPCPRLPPSPGLAAATARAEAAREALDGDAMEEAAEDVAGAVVAMLAGQQRASHATPSGREMRRITQAVRRIEDGAADRLTLAMLAAEARMSPSHFLRTFRRIVGASPHQYLLRTRLHRAALRLRRTDEAVSTIAFDEGFEDLSSFNHRFRRIMGATPTSYRRRSR